MPDFKLQSESITPSHLNSKLYELCSKIEGLSQSEIRALAYAMDPEVKEVLAEALKDYRVIR